MCVCILQVTLSHVIFDSSAQATLLNKVHNAVTHESTGSEYAASHASI